MATVFDKILDSTTGRKSYDWYRKKVQAMTTPGARALINQGKATLRPKYGVMNLFGYEILNIKTNCHTMDVFPDLSSRTNQKVTFYRTQTFII